MESYASKCQVDTRSKEDQRAIKILEETCKKGTERYEVGLLWSEDDSNLPNNFGVASAQLRSLEKRLSTQKELNEKYQKTLEVDLEKGYVREVSRKELIETKDQMQWYLPHHPVVSAHKDKVRRVCNAASKYKGQSLNDKLVAGPDLLTNLMGVSMRFREYPVAITADIEAMFMQVEVPPKDQRVLRFLWGRESFGNVGNGNLLLQQTHFWC